VRGRTKAQSRGVRRGEQRQRDAGQRCEQADYETQIKERGLRSGFLFHVITWMEFGCETPLLVKTPETRQDFFLPIFFVRS
jgi:hypothetical protein